MPETEARVGDLVAEAVARLAAAGVAEPRPTALRLWAGLADVTPGAVQLGLAGPAEPDTARRFDRGVGRLVAGEPLQYVVGTTGFRRLTLACDPRALIPRPETEGIVDLALALAPSGEALDLGTGSGCLALALADEGNYDRVTGVDRSPAALALAAENAARTGLPARWLEGDWCAPVQGERFTVVVTNPPYISEPECEALDPLVRDWEPREALAGGPDGLVAVRRLLTEVPAVLAPGGWLVMELDSTRAGAVAELALRTGWTAVRVTDDLYGRPRYLAARREMP